MMTLLEGIKTLSPAGYQSMKTVDVYVANVFVPENLSQTSLAQEMPVKVFRLQRSAFNHTSTQTK